MLKSEIRAYVAELERRWRSRTPSTDILSALPEVRVGRSEMRTWFLNRFGRDFDLDDAVEVQPALRQCFRRLRSEFPDERWD